MAYQIVESECTGCSACESECPNNAIHEKNGVFAINSKKCTECIGFFDSPQCVSACPMDACAIDEGYPRYVADELAV